jgi:DNA-binding LytR/AlgR family response regulator
MIKCLAVDDEALSLDLLEDNIKRIPFLYLAKRCKNAYEAMDVLRQEPIDVIFLDIQMPGVTGTRFLQSLPAGTRDKPVVIFITAFKKYALEGFELDVLDYLVKPVTFERFLKAVNKAADFCALKKQGGAQAAVAQPANDYFFVNVEYSLVKISVQEITHIESLRDYIKIYLLQSDKPVLTKLALKSLADRLPPARFVRIHKSFIVAIDKISVIRKNRVYIGNHIIPISDFYKEELMKAIQ